MIIGLTGKIGTGKSTLAQIKNMDILELDEIGHRVMCQPNIVNQIKDIFGEGVLDKNKQISREKLRQIVFQNEQKLRQLEKIMHPMMQKVLLAKVQRYRQENKDLLVVGALWDKFNFRQICDRIECTKLAKEKAFLRIKKRNPHFSRSEFDFVWKRQKEFA